MPTAPPATDTKKPAPPPPAQDDKKAGSKAGGDQTPGGDKNAASQQRSDRMAVRAKLSVSEPGDAVEREADAVADKVMRMAEPPKEKKDQAGGKAPAAG